MRVGLPEPRPRSEIATLLGMRIVLGGIVLAHALADLIGGGGGAYAAMLQLGVVSPGLASALLGVLRLLFGAMLITGLLTRTAAFCVALGAAGALALAAFGVHPSATPALHALVLASAALLFVVGADPLTADHALAERARRRAIEQDPIWTRPPYVEPMK